MNTATNFAGIASTAVRRIGDWRVDSAANELRRGDTVVRLEPKSMEVLLMLADRAGHVVTREALLARAWPGVVVGDDALTQVIIKLRKALGDDARTPAYIETISKRGYRLLATIDAGQPAPCTSDYSDALDRPKNLPRFSARIGMSLGGLALILLAGYWIYRTSVTDREVIPVPPDFAMDIGASMPTVSVAPFDLIGDDKDQWHLARGLASDLATDLSRLAGLRVIAADQSGHGAEKPSRARYYVYGSLQRRADRFRINVRLIESETGRQLWSDRHEHPANDLFAVQEVITRKLVDSLQVEVSHAELSQLARRHTQSLEAYDYFLRGQEALAGRQAADNERAREWYRSALAIDPGFARAYAGIALAYAEDFRLKWADDRAKSLARAREYAETAGQIDPALREVQWVYAYISVQERKLARAVDHLHRAIALDPSYADAYALLGLILTHTGRPAEAVQIMRTAMRLNPNAGYLYFQHLGRAYYFLGDSELAVINLREALMRNPADVDGHVFLVATLAAAGDAAGATWEADEIRSVRPDFSVRQWIETIPMKDAAQKRRLLDVLTSVGLS